MTAPGDRRPQYYAEYANLSSPGLPRGNNPGRADGQPAVDYPDYTGNMLAITSSVLVVFIQNLSTVKVFEFIKSVGKFSNAS